KRKKDGVFYTPKYITKYIVENTVGKLCEEKRAQLDITDEAYQATTKRSRKKLENLQLYREWLLQLTICDPACGSGAFLNEALNFLIAEHRYIDELSAKYNKDAFVLCDVEKSILENNLYGVDLNEESVEIAKLSLWLRTAQRNRKLNDLNNNLKCGNSLIDNPDIAGNKAFNWQKEFPKVFSPVDLQAFHVVLTTHNSRTSQRMIDYNVKKGPPLELKLKEEIALTQYIGEVIKEKGYCCMAYNICKDHVHLILVCEAEQLAEQVKTIKGKSSYLFQSNGFKPIGESLWSQKFFAADLDVWKLWTADNAKGYGANDQHIDRAVHYINHNREKHQLPESKELEKVIAGFVKNKEKAFSPQYKGGFDVIIGNPPYVQADDTLYNNYQTQKCGDLYAYFFERGLNIITQKGILGYITPSSFFTNIGFAPLREYLIQYDINVLIDLGENVFTDASVDSGITIITYYKTKESIIEVSDSSFNFSQIKKSIFKRLNENMFNIYINPIKFDLANSIEAGLCFDDFIEFSRGVEFGFNSDNVINERIEGYFPIICGGNLLRNQINFEGKYVNYDKNNLKIYKSKKIYEEEKILVRRIGNTIISSYDDNKYYNVCDVYNLQLKNQFKDVISLKYIAMFLNSKLIEFYFSVKFKSVKKLFPKIPIKYLKLLPIKKISLSEQQPFIEKADQMLALSKEMQHLADKFIRAIQRKFEGLEKPSKKLETWYELSFATFLKEVYKRTNSRGLNSRGLNPLGLSEEAEWEDYFLTEQQKVLTIKNKIDTTDAEIDQMVYKLYGLTEEEIKIVENS
ncbi:MAG: TaqI-like C-terminal specificity domain-containing protein, partial [Chitinophagales bacterium]